jgi:hypothetical protein
MKSPGDIGAARRVLGVTLIIAVPPIAYLARANAMGAIATLRDVQRLIPVPITNTDSATLSSAAYHAGHAAATMDGRWGMTGFMTLSSMAFALGCVLMAWPLLRRRSQ